MEHRGETTPLKFSDRRYRKNLDDGLTPAFRRFPNSILKQRQRGLSPRSSYGGQPLEVLMKEQNLLIERLRGDLEQERSVVHSLRQQCLRSSSAEDELKKIKDFLSAKGLEEVTEDGFERFKTRLEKELNLRFDERLQKEKFQHKKELEDLECRYKKELDLLKEVEKKNAALVDEINHFHKHLSLFKQNTSSFRTDGEPASKYGVEHVISELDQLNVECQHFSSPAAYICQAFCESVRGEMASKSKLIDLKASSQSNTFETSTIGDSRFVELQHSRHLCNHDNENKRPIESPANIPVSSDDEKPSALTFPTDNDHLLNYIDKLNKYIKDMVHFYQSRFCKISDSKESLAHHRTEPQESTEDCLRNSDQTSRKQNVANVKECHKMIFALNEILKSFDFHLDDALKRNRQLEGDISILKKNNIEKSVSLESHVKLLNEKIVICLRENRKLESELQRLRSCLVPKEQYDLLEKEKDKLAEVNCTLEKELRNLKEENQSVKGDFMSAEKGTERKATGDGRNQTPNSVNSSIDFDNLVTMDVATSTPFHPKLTPEEESQAPLTLDLMKSSLMEWIQRCRDLEVDKKHLERNLHNLNFLSSQTSFRKNVLEQEVVVLKNSIKCLEDKIKDYIVLKEKCYNLENDNTVLNVQNKYFDRLLNFKGNNNNGCDLPPVINFDGKLCPDEVHTPESAFNCIDEFLKKNQKIVYLESKCRSQDLRIDQLNIELDRSKELEKSLKTKLNDLIKDNVTMYEKLSKLIEDYTQVNLKKRESEIELETVKDRLKYLVSTAESFKDSTRNSLAEAMKQDAMRFLEDCIEKWTETKMNKISGDPFGRQVDKLDARHCLDILVKDNNLLRSDKEELLLKLSSLQHQFHQLQKKSDEVDTGWYTQLDKYEKELVAEIREQRKQHSRTEEALRSTVPLQKLVDTCFKEKSGLEKRLEEEKQKTKCCEAECTLLKVELKEKEKLLLDVIDEKRAIQSKLADLEKDFALKVRNYETDLFKAKWFDKFEYNKSVSTQVKEELLKLCEEVSGVQRLSEKEGEEARRQREALDEAYRESLISLRYLLQEENSRALAQAAARHSHQVTPLLSLPHSL